MSDYYVNSTKLTPYTKAKAADVDADLDAIEAGFNKLPAPHASAPGTKGFSEPFVATTATSETHAAPVKQLRESVLIAADNSSAADTYVATLTPAPASLVAGLQVLFKIPTGKSNTGACTVNLNGLGVKSIKTNDGADPAANELYEGSYAHLIYNGTTFQILSTSRAGWTSPSVTLPAASGDAYGGIRVNSDGNAYELGQPLDNRNRVLNQEMMIDQRLEGNITNGTGYNLDRVSSAAAALFSLTVRAQRTTGIGSSRASHKSLVFVAENVINAGTYYAPFMYKFLGYDVADLPSKTVTISFDFLSNAPDGSVFSIALFSGSAGRAYVSDFTYTTSATVQTVVKTVTLESGSTTITSSTTGIGMILSIAACGGSDGVASGTDGWVASGGLPDGLYSGSQRQWMSTLNEYIQISSVQLREGSRYVPLARKTRSEYLRECMPYFQKSFADGVAVAQNSGSQLGNLTIRVTSATAGTAGRSIDVRFQPPMIKAPSITFYSTNAPSTAWWNARAIPAASGASNAYRIGTTGFEAYNAGVDEDAAGEPTIIHYAAEAEL